MDTVAQEVRAIVAEGRIPSMSVAVRVQGHLVLHVTCGSARLRPERAAIEDQPYDLASVTKALAGSSVAAALIGRGVLSLDDAAARFVPEIPAGVSVRHLLQHASGYPAWAPLYASVPRSSWGTPHAREEILRAARCTSLQTPPGDAHCYSDLGFLALLAVLEACGGARLDALFREAVATPAGVDLRWGWLGAAATEDCPVREEVVEGTVHDLNCFALGGVSSHAGLFGTAAGVAELADALLDAARGERSDLPDLAPLWADQGPGSHRCGWDGISQGGYTSTGRWWPRDGVGHLGYTGTSVWIAPRQRVVVAMLSNRVHPVDDKGPIREARPRVHDAVARALGWDKAPS